jgi:hypothetical protein
MPNLRLPRQTTSNRPQLCNLLICPERFVKLTSPYYSSPHVTSIDMATPPGDEAAAYFWGIYFTPGTEIVEAGGDEDAHSVLCSWFVPCDTPSLTSWLDAILGDRHIIVYEDQMHQLKVLGSEGNGCRIAYRFTNRDGRRGYEITATVLDKMAVRHISGELRVDPINSVTQPDGIGYWYIYNEGDPEQEDDFVVS